jgi:chromosomal replication initiation ATPase DnaA
MIVSEAAESIWAGVIERLKPGIKEETFNLWLKPLKALKWEEQLLTLQVPNRFFSEWVKKNCQKDIEEALKGLLGHEAALAFEAAREIEPILKEEEARVDPIPAPKTESHFTGEQFNPKYTL